ncbi:hypothetical protein EXX38_17925 [Escherichia coli]|nr:hypothetical protein EXX38_17925 [Escherichia coli]RZY42028.1 hypothetical protein EXX31_17725 [Escherichia coli]
MPRRTALFRNSYNVFRASACAFITTVRVLRRDSNPLPSSAISDVAKYPYLLCWCRLTDSNR